VIYSNLKSTLKLTVSGLKLSHDSLNYFMEQWNFLTSLKIHAGSGQEREWSETNFSREEIILIAWQISVFGYKLDGRRYI